MPWVLSADLGQASDYTAVVAAEHAPSSVGRRYAVRHLERFQKPYPDTVKALAGLANTPPLRDAVLLLDATGVGRPVVEQVRDTLPGRIVYGVTVTSGSTVTHAGPRDIRVPKKDLVSAAQLALQSRRLTIARELPLTDQLVKELAGFRVKITPHLNETFEAWREGVHDDLVFALAMAVWFGEELPDLSGANVADWLPDPVEFLEPTEPST